MDGARAALAARQAAARALHPGTYLLACSGGSDSLALARACALEAAQAGAVLRAIVIDHGLLEGSAERAAWAKGQLTEHMPAEVLTVAVRAAGGPEGAARIARYEALAGVARARGIGRILLGHTADDQAESVLLGLGRGSGGRSISGMSPVGPLPGGQEKAEEEEILAVRPFLHLGREDLRAALGYWGQEWLEDPGNAADGPWRTADGGPLRRAAIRERALPALSEALGKDARWPLVRTADLLREDEALLRELAERLLDRARMSEAGQPALAVDALADAHPALRRRAVRAWLLEAGARPGELTGRHIRAVDELAVGETGKGVDLPGLRAVRTPLFIVRAWDTMAGHDER